MRSQTEVIELTEIALPKRAAFGEFLVTARVLDRAQLFRALQMQDRVPGARLGQCAVALGYVATAQIEHMHACFTAVLTDAQMRAELAELEAKETESFEPVEIELKLE
jgi:hypothetical protein